MKWWAQSFLVGIPSVICGYRDDDGIVTELEEFQVEKLRKMGEVMTITLFSPSNSYLLKGTFVNFSNR